MTTGELFRSAWELRPAALGACAVAVAVHLAWHRRATARLGLLVAAACVFLLAVCSPIDVLASGYLFSAHMLQHLLLVLIVPLLAVASVSPWPERDASAAASSGRHAGVAAAWLLGVGAMWLWHAPVLCNAASRSLAVHRLQDVSLLVMGGAFWWPIAGPRRGARLSPLAASAFLVTACLACTLLGILVTFSPVEVCAAYLNPVDKLGLLPLLRGDWGLTPARDQEIGGLLMWLPPCVVYLGAVLVELERWYRGDDPGHGAVEARA